MYKLHLTYKETRSGGDICDGQENDSWPNYECEYVDFTPLALYKERPEKLYVHGLNELEVNGNFKLGDDACLVIVRYDTGNTFGCSKGNWYIIGVYKTSEEANEIMKTIPNNYMGYKVWNGYFERFESVDIFYFKVL